MAALIRFFSRRFGRKKEVPSYNYVGEVFGKFKTKKTKKSDLECKVTYLDGTTQTFFISKNGNASELYDIALPFVGINDDKDYFGLTYQKNITIWLDRTKGLKHQCDSKGPYAIALKVKFFSSDPTNIQDEYTRYLFTLQLRDDIQSGELACNDLRLAAELSAILLQAEFGDYDPKQHTHAFVSTFRFLPEGKQTPEFEDAVLQQYKLLGGRNLNPADADALYLNRVRHLPDYGVDMHKVLGNDKQEYSLGLTPTGILVYEGQKKIGLFFWRDVVKLEMRRKQLKILVSEEDAASRKVIEHAFCFVLPSSDKCKQLWKNAVEYHCFFRLTDHSKPPPARRQLFRLRSRFHASFKNTEYQMHNNNLFGSSSFRKHKTGTKSAPGTPTLGRAPASPEPASSPSGVTNTTSFRRVPSKRFSPRPSFTKRGQLAPSQPSSASSGSPRDADAGLRAPDSPTSVVTTTANVETKNGSTTKRFTWRNKPPGEGHGGTPEIQLRKVDKHASDQTHPVNITPPTARITPLLPKTGYRPRNNGPPAPSAPFLDTVV